MVLELLYADRHDKFDVCVTVHHIWKWREVYLVRNVMAHAQKPEFVFPRNGRVHLNQWGHQFSRLLAVEECRPLVVMVVMLDRPHSKVKWNCTGYPLHSLVSPSLPLPCVTVCHQVPNELYQLDATIVIYYHKYLYMFRASICPSSGVQVVCYCIWCSAL